MMLFWPRRWFELPGYIGLHGSMRKEMLSRLVRRLQVRSVGLVLVTFVSFVLVSITTHPRGYRAEIPTNEDLPPAVSMQPVPPVSTQPRSHWPQAPIEDFSDLPVPRR